MKLFCFFLSFVGLGCAPHPHTFNVDPAFQTYVKDFYKEAAKRGVSVENDDLVVMFDSNKDLISRGLLGECHDGKDQTPLIRISQKQWNFVYASPGSDQWHINFNEYNRRMLIYHELGHCLLGRSHRMDLTTEIDVNVKQGHYWRSIMFPSAMILSVDFYVANWNEYVDELFEQGDGPI